MQQGPPRNQSTEIPCRFVSGLYVLPKMAKHLSHTLSAIAETLRASLVLDVRDKCTKSRELSLTARALERERMVRGRSDVGGHVFVFRKSPIALVAAKASGTAFEDGLRLEPLARASEQVLFAAWDDVMIRKCVFGCKSVHLSARGEALFGLQMGEHYSVSDE